MPPILSRAALLLCLAGPTALHSSLCTYNVFAKEPSRNPSVEVVAIDQLNTQPSETDELLNPPSFAETTTASESNTERPSGTGVPTLSIPEIDDQIPEPTAIAVPLSVDTPVVEQKVTEFGLDQSKAIDSLPVTAAESSSSDSQPISEPTPAIAATLETTTVEPVIVDNPIVESFPEPIIEVIEAPAADSSPAVETVIDVALPKDGFIPGDVTPEPTAVDVPTVDLPLTESAAEAIEVPSANVDQVIGVDPAIDVAPTLEMPVIETPIVDSPADATESISDASMAETLPAVESVDTAPMPTVDSVETSTESVVEAAPVAEETPAEPALPSSDLNEAEAVVEVASEVLPTDSVEPTSTVDSTEPQSDSESPVVVMMDEVPVVNEEPAPVEKITEASTEPVAEIVAVPVVEMTESVDTSPAKEEAVPTDAEQSEPAASATEITETPVPEVPGETPVEAAIEAPVEAPATVEVESVPVESVPANEDSEQTSTSGEPAVVELPIEGSPAEMPTDESPVVEEPTDETPVEAPTAPVTVDEIPAAVDSNPAVATDGDTSDVPSDATSEAPTEVPAIDLPTTDAPTNEEPSLVNPEEESIPSEPGSSEDVSVETLPVESIPVEALPTEPVPAIVPADEPSRAEKTPSVDLTLENADELPVVEGTALEGVAEESVPAEDAPAQNVEPIDVPTTEIPNEPLAQPEPDVESPVNDNSEVPASAPETETAAEPVVVPESTPVVEPTTEFVSPEEAVIEIPAVVDPVETNESESAPVVDEPVGSAEEAEMIEALPVFEEVNLESPTGAFSICEPPTTDGPAPEIAPSIEAPTTVVTAEESAAIEPAATVSDEPITESVFELPVESSDGAPVEPSAELPPLPQELLEIL